MNILVSGGAGFIGANLVRRLLKDKLTVHVLQPKTSNLWRLKVIEKKISIHHAPLTNLKRLRNLLRKIQPTIIYHLAAYGACPNQLDTKRIILTNIAGTVNLLAAAKDLDLACFVNTGSSTEYGKKDKPMNENDRCAPETLYASSKLATTNIAAVFAKRYSLPLVTMRPFSVYGPYENKSRFIPTIISSLVENKPVKITSDKVRHDFIYVDDVVDAYIAAASNPNTAIGNIFNVGTGCEYTCAEVVKAIFKITGRKVPIKKGAYQPREWDHVHWRADISLVKKTLSWKAETTLEVGLAKTIQWFTKKYNGQI